MWNRKDLFALCRAWQCSYAPNRWDTLNVGPRLENINVWLASVARESLTTWLALLTAAKYNRSLLWDMRVLFCRQPSRLELESPYLSSKMLALACRLEVSLQAWVHSIIVASRKWTSTHVKALHTRWCFGRCWKWFGLTGAAMFGSKSLAVEHTVKVISVVVWNIGNTNCNKNPEIIRYFSGNILKIREFKELIGCVHQFIPWKFVWVCGWMVSHGNKSVFDVLRICSFCKGVRCATRSLTQWNAIDRQKSCTGMTTDPKGSCKFAYASNLTLDTEDGPFCDEKVFSNHESFRPLRFLILMLYGEAEKCIGFGFNPRSPKTQYSLSTTK